jgi:hypothetical protein
VLILEIRVKVRRVQGRLRLFKPIQAFSMLFKAKNKKIIFWSARASTARRDLTAKNPEHTKL